MTSDTGLPRPEDVEAIQALHLAELSVPGPLIRPIPGFTMGVPQGWLVRDCPGAMFAMGTADDYDGPWANVIVRHDRVMGDATLESVAAVGLLQLRADYPDASVLDTTAVEFFRTHYIQTATLTMEGWDGLVTRTDSYVFGPEPAASPVADLFHIIWMHAYESTGPYAELFAAMMGSIAFTDDVGG